MGDNGIAAAQYRDLYFYSLYRVLEAGLLVLILFGPISELVPVPAYPLLGKATALAYVAMAGVLLSWAMSVAWVTSTLSIGSATPADW